MKYLNFILGLLVTGVMGTAASANAAQVALSLRLQDLSGNDLVPFLTNNYVLPVGSEFNVVLSAEVRNPNMTDDLRGNPLTSNRALGLQVLNVNLMTSGSIFQTVPGADPGIPQTWHGYTDLTPDGLGFPSVNLIDVDGDGDLDVAGAGMANITTSLAAAASASTLAKVQYGASGIIDIVLGSYIMTGILPTMISTSTSAGIVYFDPANQAGDSTAAKAALGAQDVLSTLTEAQVFFAIPEPGGILGVIGLLLTYSQLRRRRFATSLLAAGRG